MENTTQRKSIICSKCDVACSIKCYYLYAVLTKLQNAAAAPKLYPQCVILI